MTEPRVESAAPADAVGRSLSRIARSWPGPAPEIALLLGSGWDAVADAVASPVDIAYADLPAFPLPGVAGHAGILRLGRIGGRPVALLRGRGHAYESGDAAAMKGAIRTLAAWGCRALLLTNAAGSLQPAMPAGSLMLISDHLNIAQRTPLHFESGDERFVDMCNAYDAALRAQALAAASAAGIALPEGVYAWMLGPQFETPAEIRMLRRLGADAVGMSTVPETILARHAGLKVLGLSMLTNLGAGLDDQPLGHAQTLAAARAGAESAARLLVAVIAGLRI